MIDLRLLTVSIDKGDGVNLILGQSHLVKTVEDIHETLVQTVRGIKLASLFGRRLVSCWCVDTEPKRR